MLDIHNTVKKTPTSVNTGNTEESSSLVESQTHSSEQEINVSSGSFIPKDLLFLVISPLTFF
jgi:hypothetical protein